MSTRVRKAMAQPINLIFRMLQQKSRVSIWLYEQTESRIEGRIIVQAINKGFDEFMSLVLDDAEEVVVKTGLKKPLGRILLRGDNITLLAPAD